MVNVGKRKIIYIVLIAMALAAAAFCIRIPRVERDTFIAMDTVVSVTLYRGINASEALFGKESSLKKIRTDIEDIDRNVANWRSGDSECAAFNSLDSKEDGYPAGDEFMDLTKKSIEIAEGTGGYVDPAMGRLIDVWNIEDSYGLSGYIPPEMEAVREAANESGYENIYIEDGYIYSHKDIKLDFGAFGKGYALDRIYDIVSEDKSVKGGVVSVGGSIMAFGSKKGNKDYEIGIRDPEGSVNDILGTLTWGETEKVCVSTSGSYERYAESADGDIYSHILDINTMAPVETELLSVTIVSPEGIVSDGLSTACFVMDREQSESILRRYSSEGIFVYDDHSVYITEGLFDHFTLSSADYYIRNEMK